MAEADYRGRHKIWLRFDDGTRGVADLANHLNGPMFGPLRDPEQFRRFRVDAELGTVVWENGADLAPEFLKELVVSAHPKPAAAASTPSPRTRRR
ncbi:MAG: DUF2442 domain-containing protein [Phycisphaerae bacterium]